MSVQTDLHGALSPLVAAGRVHPVVFPEDLKFEAGPAILYVVDDSKIDPDTVTLCDALGLVPHTLWIGLVGLDYNALWALRDQCLTALAGLSAAGFAVAMAGRDGPFNAEHQTYLVEIKAVARRAIV